MDADRWLDAAHGWLIARIGNTLAGLAEDVLRMVVLALVGGLVVREVVL